MRSDNTVRRFTRTSVPAVFLALALLALPVSAAAADPAPSSTAPPYTPTAAQGDLNERLHEAVSQPVTGCASNRTAPTLAYARLGAQIVDSLIVSNAVRHGSIGRAFGGSASSPVPYALEQYALDVAGSYLVRRSSCGVQNAVIIVEGASAIYNAAATEFPK